MALSRIFVAPKNGQGGVKKSKKNFFQKKYSKDGEKILGPLRPYLPKIDGGVRGRGSDPRSLPIFVQSYGGRNLIEGTCKKVFLQLWSQRSQNLLFPSFEYAF